ncbi:hypothetical protein PAAG_02434 [Paracoccidioides lutzii Pb01]|uniref:Uncharacterized protein n=1 Tax=Paracoccidioides lutzii (strain ATCC MYA-826 / Pb01) TaxID=502779 RepID=C1GUW1_PARBA|nr:hypothetical protein PAAG_02434 [Paracoccidioides lutzii Pb01]EEH40379.2 hypothetical protein PAAG_02434 [Paracoccidioides lutzii Pb01]
MADVDPHTNTGFTSTMDEAAAASQQEGLGSAKTERSQSTGDPFASQRTPDNDPFARTASTELSPVATSPSPQQSPIDRRMSKEWDASKVPPSRFQRREGSIFSTSSSRDSHLSRKDRDSAFHAKLKEKVS